MKKLVLFWVCVLGVAALALTSASASPLQGMPHRYALSVVSAVNDGADNVVRFVYRHL